MFQPFSLQATVAETQHRREQINAGRAVPDGGAGAGGGRPRRAVRVVRRRVRGA